MGAASWASCTVHTCTHPAVSPFGFVSRRPSAWRWRRVPTLANTSPPGKVYSVPQPLRIPRWASRSGMGWGGGRSWVSRMRTLAPPPRHAEDGLLRCKQLTVLLDWAEQFEAESCQSDEAVAFSVLLGDLNFDNCSLGKTACPPPQPRASAYTHTPSIAFPQTTSRSRNTSFSAASGTPAGWARAGSSPGPWVHRVGAPGWGQVDLKRALRRRPLIPSFPAHPRDVAETLRAPPLRGLLARDAA